MSFTADDMEKSLKDLLRDLDRVNDLRERAGKRRLQDRTLGAYAARDSSLVLKLRAGEARRVHPEIVDRVRAWIKLESAKYSKAKGRK